MTQDPKPPTSDKNYSDLVEFPVELVDRDGVIRRYSYSESLRVYLRRIASAHLRYTDDTRIAAEVDHCNKRIDQLRRSHLHRCRSLGARLAVDRRTTAQSVLGEGLSLLHEQLGDPLFGAAAADTEIVAITEEENPAVYQVSDGHAEESYLLYVFELESALFETYRRSFTWGQHGGAMGEHLVVAREGETADFLLTRTVRRGAGDESEPSGLRTWSEPDPSEDPAPPGSAEFAAGLVALRRREPAQAIGHFKDAVVANPYQREAYLALSTLLDSIGSVEEGEMYTLLAMSYLPADGLLRFNRGLNLLRQGRKADALEAFERAAELDTELYQPRYFAGLIHAVEGRIGSARREFTAALDLAGSDRNRVDVALQWVRHRARIRTWCVAGVGMALLLAACVAPWNLVMALPFAGVALLIALAYPVQTRLARRWFARYSLTAGDGRRGDLS